jgi:hypothetical protein
MAWMKARVERDHTREHQMASVITIEPRTLAQRLAEGGPATADALQLAIDLAQALRTLHDGGRFHGALSPFSIELNASGIELREGRTLRGVPTPYTAPEVLQGGPADARSDIFSFGVIVFEMVTGGWPFNGDTPESLAIALQNAPVPVTGNAALDALLAHCLAKDPTERWPRMQKAQMELKLALVAARRSESPVRREHFQAFVRAEVEAGLESRVAGRLESQGNTVLDLQQSAAIAAERMNRVERAIESAEKHATEFAGDAATQLHALQQTVRAQAAALESARLALAQTDDLVERVVEALDSLQTIVLERTEFIPGAVIAQNGIRAVRTISG